MDAKRTRLAPPHALMHAEHHNDADAMARTVDSVPLIVARVLLAEESVTEMRAAARAERLPETPRP